MRNTKTFKPKHVIAAWVMLLALAWLTVSLPYVISFQQEIAKQESKSGPFNCPIDNEESNPLGNATEEKAPTAAEEYLHHTDDHNYLFCYRLSHDNRHAYDIYVAYHGEVQSPPPNFIS